MTQHGVVQTSATTPVSVSVLRERFEPVFRRHGIERAILFGSYARHEATRHSDIDLLLVQPTTRRFLDRLDGLLLELSQASPGPAVEALVYTPEEFVRLQDQSFIATAVREGILLYESNRQ